MPFRPLLLACALATALPAGAQDRPPAGTDAAPAVTGDDRPPERPEPSPDDAAASEAAQPAPTGDDAAGDDAATDPRGSGSAASQTDLPQTVPPETAPSETATDDATPDTTPETTTGAPAREPFGPPPPPVWFTLAESDADFTACRLTLQMLGTRFTQEPPVADPDLRDCGIARPLRVTEILPGIALTGEPVMRCTTARSLALWTQGFLRPAVALMPDAPRLTALQTGPAYNCRDRIGTGKADPKPSEHGYGNAVDVMGFVFEDAEPMPVQPRQGDGDAAESLLKAAQGSACLLFTTVLGPGSNAAHDDHLHLDMAARNGGWRLCE
ncbi:extensin family protein [Paracoccus nototheniae]|uniref:Extensin family protein n=1 Tax=Paracoccus nototheniae TaxID=2489002 RepID=A0ABW4DWH4_9RHOB|nr:extensin family protein [Paracoccus nototheniae]